MAGWIIDQILSLWSHGREVSGSVGMSLLHACWPSHTAAQEAGAAAEVAASRKVEKYIDLGARYIFEILNQLRQKPCVQSTHQLTTSLMTLEGGFL